MEVGLYLYWMVEMVNPLKWGRTSLWSWSLKCGLLHVPECKSFDNPKHVHPQPDWRHLCWMWPSISNSRGFSSFNKKWAKPCIRLGWWAFFFGLSVGLSLTFKPTSLLIGASWIPSLWNQVHSGWADPLGPNFCNGPVWALGMIIPQQTP
jgi:hypothetical protein